MRLRVCGVGPEEEEEEEQTRVANATVVQNQPILTKYALKMLFLRAK